MAAGLIAAIATVLPVGLYAQSDTGRVTGNVATEKTEIVVGDSGRIIFGTCSCAFFQDNLMGKGPCEHMLALFKASADGRKD